jgi:hypothetical protein
MAFSWADIAYEYYLEYRSKPTNCPAQARINVEISSDHLGPLQLCYFDFQSFIYVSKDN